MRLLVFLLVGLLATAASAQKNNWPDSTAVPGPYGLELGILSPSDKKIVDVVTQHGDQTIRDLQALDAALRAPDTSATYVMQEVDVIAPATTGCDALPDSLVKEFGSLEIFVFGGVNGRYEWCPYQPEVVYEATFVNLSPARAWIEMIVDEKKPKYKIYKLEPGERVDISGGRILTMEKFDPIGSKISIFSILQP